MNIQINPSPGDTQSGSHTEADLQFYESALVGFTALMKDLYIYLPESNSRCSQKAIENFLITLGVSQDRAINSSASLCGSIRTRIRLYENSEKEVVRVESERVEPRHILKATTKIISNFLNDKQLLLGSVSENFKKEAREFKLKSLTLIAMHSREMKSEILGLSPKEAVFELRLKLKAHEEIIEFMSGELDYEENLLKLKDIFVGDLLKNAIILAPHHNEKEISKLHNSILHLLQYQYYTELDRYLRKHEANDNDRKCIEHFTEYCLFATINNLQGVQKQLANINL